MRLKHILLLSILFVTLLSCRRDPVPGPMGPQGFQGPQGAPGPAAYIWETKFDFLNANNYAYIWRFPSDFTVYGTDVVLAYFLYDTYWDDTKWVDVWKPLPLHYYKNEGMLYYSFDHSIHDVVFKMQTDNAALLIPTWTNDWIARIVLIEGNVARSSTNVDYSDYNAVIEHFNITDLPSKERTKTERK
jgi:hypothetical protein